MVTALFSADGSSCTQQKRLCNGNWRIGRLDRRTCYSGDEIASARRSSNDINTLARGAYALGRCEWWDLNNANPDSRSCQVGTSHDAGRTSPISTTAAYQKQVELLPRNAPQFDPASCCRSDDRFAFGMSSGRDGDAPALVVAPARSAPLLLSGPRNMHGLIGSIAAFYNGAENRSVPLPRRMAQMFDATRATIGRKHRFD